MASANRNTDNSNLGPKTAATTHPLYDLMKPVWEQLAHVREGTGGFLDGTYLVAHPREYLDHTVVTSDSVTGAKVSRTNPNPRSPSPKLLARRRLARYENVASSILEAKKSALFREQPTRRVGEQAPATAKPKPQPEETADPLKPKAAPAPKPVEKPEPTEVELWWENVDGDEGHIDDVMVQWWDLAATFGHVVLYLDIAAATDDEPKTAADQATPYVRLYTPLDVLDWRHDENGCLVWIKLLEATQEPYGGPLGDARSTTSYRLRIVDETSWKLYDYKSGKFVSQGPHGFGKLPVTYLYAKRRSLLADIGESVLGDPRNYIDLFNLSSEKRELLRAQTFSIINVPLGTGQDAMSVESAQAMMGTQTGTMNVLFSGAAAQILTGDAANVKSYEEAESSLRREIYRIAGIQWSADSKDAESAAALELKQDEMNVRLSAYADECQKAEYALAELWYRARYGADLGPTKMEDAQVTIHYPEHFTPTPFEDVLNQVEAAQAIGMPALFLKELRKAIVSKFEGMSNLTPETQQMIMDAIDAAPDDPTPAERVKQKMDLLAAAGGQQPGKPGAKVPADLDPEKAA